MSRHKVVIAAVVTVQAGLLLAGCTLATGGTSSALHAGSATGSAANGGSETPAGAAAAVPSLGGKSLHVAGATTAVADYTISPLDVIEVDVFKTPDLNKTAQVDAGGKITLPLIGEVTAGGKTTHQLELEVQAALGAKYLQSPEVSVYIKDALSQRVTVEGAVGHPGIFPTTGRTSLMQAIALSGGLNDVADSNAVIVFRSVGGKRQAAIFDYKAIRAGKVDDPILQGGDIVAVDELGAKATMRNLRETIGVFNLFAPLAAL